MKLSHVLAYKFPDAYAVDAYVVMEDDDGQSIHSWDADAIGRGEPTQSEITTWETEYAAVEYKVLRRDQYPPLQDLADAIYWGEKGDDSMMTAYVAACEKVKEDFPKNG